MTFEEAKPGILISYMDHRWLFLVKNKNSITSVFVKMSGTFFSIPKLFEIPKKSFSQNRNIFAGGNWQRGEELTGEKKFSFIKLLITKIFTIGISDDI